MADPVEMTYVALRPLRVGGRTRQKGELVPEAATWHNIDAYVRGGRIAPVPVTAVNAEELEAATTAWKGSEDEEPQAETEEAGGGADEVEPQEDDDPAEDDESEDEPESEDDLEQYATGSGWYEVPGADKKMRRDEALEFLTSPEDESEE
jgi:hypothetical protein